MVRIQNEDGSWGFDPDGKVVSKKGKNAESSDPAPTALAIMGLTSAGRGKDDPVVAKGVKALLAMQDPSGRWNRAAQTGFVTSAYALHALSRIYPASKDGDEDVAIKNNSLPAIVKQTRNAALHGNEKILDNWLKQPSMLMLVCVIGP